MSGMSVNGVFIEGSEVVTKIFIDSGKTTTALPRNLFNAVIGYI